MTCDPTLELVHPPTLPLTGGLGGPQPAEGDRENDNHTSHANTYQQSLAQ